MKRLLLIAHQFPPAPSPGALRPGYLARYLPNWGWNVTTITATLDEPPFAARVLHVSGTWQLQERIRAQVVTKSGDPFSPVRVVLRSIKEMLLFPDATAPWMMPAIKAGVQHLQQERYDAILSTAMPATAHVIAWFLAMRFRLPWIADYRDPWTGNFYDVRGGPFRKFVAPLLERAIMRRANALSTTLPGFSNLIGRFNRRKVEIIPNAYDPSDWDSVPDMDPEGFNLCFTGSMYNGKRSPELLFAALAELKAEGDPAGAASVHFYGRNLHNVAAAAVRHGIGSSVNQHDVVPHSEALRAQRASAGLLIFLNMDSATSHEMGSKYLEYLGARRPILVFGPPDSVMRPFMTQQNLGWFASTVTEAKEAVRGAHAAFTQGNWENQMRWNDIPSATELARSFATLLDRISQ